MVGSFRPVEGRCTSPGSKPYQFTMCFPRLDGNFTGTGDLFSALFLAWSRKHPAEQHIAVQKTVATLQVRL